MPELLETRFFLPPLVLMRQVAAPVKISTSDNHLRKPAREFPKTVISTGAELGENYDFQYCTGNVSGSD